jgi:hypothetical protein
MATLKIYPGNTGMQQSLQQVRWHIEQEQREASVIAQPREALSFLEIERIHQARGRRLADLWSLEALLAAHLEQELIDQSIREARAELRAKGASEVKARGWRWTKVQLLGGLVVRLETPYVQVGRKRRRSRRGGAGSGLHALLWKMGVKDRLSPASRSEIARKTVLLGSYAEAREQLGREGLELPSSGLVQAAVSTGAQALRLRDEALAKARKAPVPLRSSLAGLRVRISLDGGRARVRHTRRGRGIRPGANKRRPFELAWVEPRVLTIDVLDEEGKPLRSARPVYEISLGSAEQVMELLVGTLRLLGVHLCSEVVFVADGAEWIWSRVEQAFRDAGLRPERLHLVLDYYHVTESISEAIAACKNLSASERSALFEELRGTLLEPAGAQRVFERLAPLARGRRAKTVGATLGYLEQHLHLMPYASLRDKKLPIGSGVVESAVRRLVNLRFKGASICWRPDHLEPLLYLRAILKAGHWDQFFESLLQGRHWLSSASMMPRSKRRAA